MDSEIFIATTGSGLRRAARLGENGSWEVLDLCKGEDIRCLAADRHDRNVVFAGAQGGGVLKSIDRGLTWAGSGLVGMEVKSLACSPTQSGTVYAGVKPAGIYISSDSGASWRELESFQHIKGRWYWMSPAEPPFKAYVQSIALSPTDPQVILAGIEAGAVVRSQDGGQSWSGHLKGSIRDCHNLTFHGKDGNWVYEAGGGGHGAAFSRDAGISWSQPKDGLDRNYGWACAADAEKPEVWYVSVSKTFVWPRLEPAAHVDGYAHAYIFRSVGGAAFEKLGGGLPQPLDYMAYSLICHPSTSGELYAGLSNGEVWQSRDYGDNWVKLPFVLGKIQRSLILI